MLQYYPARAWGLFCLLQFPPHEALPGPQGPRDRLGQGTYKRTQRAPWLSSACTVYAREDAQSPAGSWSGTWQAWGTFLAAKRVGVRWGGISLLSPGTLLKLSLLFSPLSFFPFV